MSPLIVDAVRSLCLSSGWTFDHVYDAGDGGSSDEHWARKFSREGGDAILTADADFTNRHPQIVAIFDTGLKVIHLPARWGSAPGHLQAGHILVWWPRIEKQLGAMKARECYRPEWNVSAETGSWKKVDIDFARARKKMKRADRTA